MHFEKISLCMWPTSDFQWKAKRHAVGGGGIVGNICFCPADSGHRFGIAATRFKRNSEDSSATRMFQHVFCGTGGGGRSVTIQLSATQRPPS